MTREISFHQAIREGTDLMMARDPTVYLIGLGVPDPKAVFGTTSGLQKKYGPDRVMDMPAAENGMTGIVIGSALMGMRPILVHQRVDFALLSLDQLINNAAKWHYTFDVKVPLVVRVLVGRGWGQGPQHSQSLHALFAHIPGLKVVLPSCAYDAKGLLISAIEDDDPVVFIEHRWLHNIFGDVPEGLYRVPIGKAKMLREGVDLTVVASSHMSLEAWRAAELVAREGISIELIDVRTLRPLDIETILASVRKTRKLLVIDGDWKTGGFAGEVLALVAEEGFDMLDIPPARLTYPDHPCPTSWTLANHYYPTSSDIARKVCMMCERAHTAQKLFDTSVALRSERPLDVPDSAFQGPF